jgi:hypothetical protein
MELPTHGNMNKIVEGADEAVDAIYNNAAPYPCLGLPPHMGGRDYPKVPSPPSHELKGGGRVAERIQGGLR